MQPEFLERVQRFDALASRIPHSRRRGFVLEHKMDEGRFQALQWYVRAYISASLLAPGHVFSEEEILARLADRSRPILNKTPNGVLMPKYEFSMEYNMLHSCLVRLLDCLDLDSLTLCWQLPFIVRVVAGHEEDPMASLRPYSATKIHSDVWVGEPSDLILLNIPILGDVEKTGMRWLEPPPELGESHLKVLNDFKEGEEIAGQASVLDLVWKQGHLYFSDAAVLHQTVQSGGRYRVSIDLRFRMKTSPEYKKQVEARALSKYLEQYVSWPAWKGVGSHSIVVFEDRCSALQQNPAPSFSGKYLLFDFGR